MKRLVSVLILMLAVMTTFAQQDNQHLKFMGIPITGNISQFQAKLTAKGCIYNKQASASISSGTRAFKGTFAGNKVDIYVYYDTQSKIVYRVKAVVSGTSEDLANQKYEEYKSLLERKYGSNNMITDTKDGKESASFISLKDPALEVDWGNGGNFTLPDIANGTIDLYITQDEETWIRSPYNYNVHIDYYDILNSRRNENQKLNDI